MSRREASVENIILMMKILDLEKFDLSQSDDDPYGNLSKKIIGAKMTPFRSEIRIFRREDGKVSCEYPGLESSVPDEDAEEIVIAEDGTEFNVSEVRRSLNEPYVRLRDPRESEIGLMYRTLRKRLRHDVVENLIDDLMDKASQDN